VFVCEACRESIDLSDPELVYAVRLSASVGFLETELVEGAGVYFHEECFPWDSPAYQERPRLTVVARTT
jgi:hypothetical protein